MPTFAYTAKGRDGKSVKGTQAAESKQVLIRMLQAQGLTPDQNSIKEGGKQVVAKTNKRVKSDDLLVFTRQLATMVSAGLPILQSLDILAEQADDPGFQAIIRTVAQNVEGGETFSETLRGFPRAFPDLYVSMVRAGEAGGDLDGVLLKLADLLENSAELKRRVKSAMMYPAVSFSFICLIAGLLIMFMVPQFAKLFADLGGELPMPTQILIMVSDTMRSFRMLIVVAFVLAMIFLARAYRATPRGRYNTDALMLRAPVLGMLIRRIAVARFTRTLGTLTRSGVAILQALEIVEATAGNQVIAKAIREAADSVRNGETLADPMARTGVFPPMVTRMIGVGEKTGALEIMLEKIADFYDSEVRAAVDSLTSLIEPILIIFMGVIVGSVVIALILPILNMSELVS